jgi:hypothetical protein
VASYSSAIPLVKANGRKHVSIKSLAFLRERSAKIILQRGLVNTLMQIFEKPTADL